MWCAKFDGFGTFAWLVDHITESRVFFVKSYGSNSAVHQRFQAALRDLWREELDDLGLNYTEHTLIFALGGVFAVLFEWARAKTLEPNHQVLQRVNELAASVLPAAS